MIDINYPRRKEFSHPQRNFHINDFDAQSGLWMKSYLKKYTIAQTPALLFQFIP